MNFEKRSIMPIIKDFITSCPFLSDYGIETSDITYEKLNNNQMDSVAIDYVGSQLLSSQTDIVDHLYSIRQANFIVWLLRSSEQDIYREETADFLWNFEQWVEHAQANGQTPKISLKENYDYPELWWADGGTFSSTTEGSKSIYVYKVNLHIRY